MEPYPTPNLVWQKLDKIMDAVSFTDRIIFGRTNYSSLFDPFPAEMGTDTAFLDRIHCYLPGWEIPKFRPEHFTDDYGFITDYLAEFLRELRNSMVMHWISTIV